MWRVLAVHKALTAFVIAFYVVFLVLGVRSENDQVWIYAGFIAAAFVGIAWWHSRRQFSTGVLWGLAFWGALAMAGGLFPIEGERVLYQVQLLPFLRFDQLVHVIGFGVAGLAFWESVQHFVDRRLTTGASLVFMGGLAFGAINEMVEFLITRVAAETNIGGFANTGWDLVANTVGAGLAAAWTRWKWSGKRMEAT